jgi:hypothetical protein
MESVPHSRSFTFFIAILLAPLLLLAAACMGDDDDDVDVDIPDHPAEDVAGVWEGELASDRLDRELPICVEIEQDGRALEGRMVMDGQPPVQVAGTVDETTMTLLWGPGAGDEPDAAPMPGSGEYAVTAGGSLTGRLDDGAVAGRWGGLGLDEGSVQLQESDAGECPS